MTLLIEQRVTSLAIIGQGIDTSFELVFEKVSVATVAAQGPPGPAGTPGPVGGIQKFDISNAATWIINHTFGRRPMVQFFLQSGEQIYPDSFVTDSLINAVFANPASGFVLAN